MKADDTSMITKLSQNKTLPKWSFPGRRPASAGARGIMTTPGPGSYSGSANTVRRATPSYGFGSSTRNHSTLKRSNSTPGPGQYAQGLRPQSAAPRFGFGTEKRGGVHSGSAAEGSSASTPGPGTYAPSWEKTKHDAPKFTATPRRDGYRSGSTTPGPGTYKQTDRPDSANGPRWAFGTSKRERPGSDLSSPGPGAYPGQHGFGEGTQTGPKYTMRMRTGHSHSASNLKEALGHSEIGGPITQFGY